jgi:spore coat polysaccharide biosynthesis predicted glycosyltransferase SpsG
VGFGHLVRCRTLARALGVEPVMAVRGSRATRAMAVTLGTAVADAHSDAGLRALAPALLVVDDPSATCAEIWVRRARRAGIPVATLHDLGRAYVASDLVIDGTVRFGPRPEGSAMLAGPGYAVLDAALAAVRRRSRKPRIARVLVALGGGRHVRALAAPLCLAIARHVPGADIHVARGFAGGAASPALPHVTWIDAPYGLAGELAEASIAVVAGGVTLYEACAVGVPVVAVAVVPAQRESIRSLARQGAVVDGGPSPLDGAAAERVAEIAARLMTNTVLAARQSRRARLVVDGLGARRVAHRLRALMRAPAFRQAARSSREALRHAS